MYCMKVWWIYWIHAVPGRESLQQVGVAHQAGAGQDDLVHHLQVIHRDQMLQVHGAAHDHQRHDNHGETGENRAGDKIGRENRHVPAGNQRHGEVERHDAVDREDEPGGKSGDDQVGFFVMLPVRCRAAPSDAQDGVDELANLVCRSIPQRSQVGNQSQIPEQQRNQ